MQTKKAYQTDRYGLLAGETVADESPLEPGVFLLPAGATFTPPPASWPRGKWPRWNGSAWELVSFQEKPEESDPVSKLRDFLDANPDVAAILNQGKE